MATRVGHGSICVILFNSPTPKTRCWTQKSPIYLVYKRVIADFVSNFVTMATEVGRGKFVWRHSIARPQNPLLYAKISGIFLIQAELYRFCSKFRCHGNRVGRSRICLASFNSPTPKPPVVRKNLGDITRSHGSVRVL